MVNTETTLFYKKRKKKKKKEEIPGAVPRKKIWGGQMDLAAQWKTRPEWLESGREKCRSNNWDWSWVHKHELCQLDVSTLPGGLNTFPINILKMCERCSLCVRGTVDRTVLCCNTFCFSFTWCITYKNESKEWFFFSWKNVLQKQEVLRVTQKKLLTLLNESRCNHLMLERVSWVLKLYFVKLILRESIWQGFGFHLKHRNIVKTDFKIKFACVMHFSNRAICLRCLCLNSSWVPVRLFGGIRYCHVLHKHR